MHGAGVARGPRSRSRLEAGKRHENSTLESSNLGAMPSGEEADVRERAFSDVYEPG